MYKELKWTIDNFDFYYVGDKNLYSYFNSEIYNKKLKKLIDNDEILCYNFKKLKEKWDYLKENRITFDILIEKEYEIILNEIQKALDIFDFFDWYIKRTSNCFINLIDKKLLEINDLEDTIIIVLDLSGNIIGMLDSNGDIIPLPSDLNLNNSNVYYITSANADHISELQNCDGKEITMVGQEYAIC